LLDYPDLSVGTIHNILQAAVSQVRALNQAQDLVGIRVGAHDEIYQAGRPVLVGADVKSTYCYLLAEEDHCDETTWGVHLLGLADQGLRPDYTVADGGLALRAGQAAAWESVPCHGDVFHAERDLGNLAFYLEHRASGCTSARQKLEHQMERRKRHGRGNQLSKRLAVTRQPPAQLLLPAPGTGKRVLGPVAVLPEPPALPTQPAPATDRAESNGTSQRSKPPALAGPPGLPTVPPELTRHASTVPSQLTRDATRPVETVTSNRPFLNHAGFR
jgi:hypothetical protein